MTTPIRNLSNARLASWLKRGEAPDRRGVYAYTAQTLPTRPIALVISPPTWSHQRTAAAELKSVEAVILYDAPEIAAISESDRITVEDKGVFGLAGKTLSVTRRQPIAKNGMAVTVQLFVVELKDAG